jgi:hypothetical protein
MRPTFAIIFLFLAGCVSSATKTVEDLIPDNLDDVSSVVQENLAVAHASGTSLYTYAGVALFVLGALSFAFFNRTAGLQLILAGAIAGSVPFVVASAYFAWIIGGTMIAVAGLGVWHLWFKIKEAEAADNAQANKKD